MKFKPTSSFFGKIFLVPPYLFSFFTSLFLHNCFVKRSLLLLAFPVLIVWLLNRIMQYRSLSALFFQLVWSQSEVKELACVWDEGAVRKVVEREGYAWFPQVSGIILRSFRNHVKMQMQHHLICLTLSHLYSVHRPPASLSHNQICS